MDFTMKKMLKIAIANDSLYLSKHSIIDYSMFVIINPETKRIRFGIIDYIQQYTFEKELESFVKHKMSSIKEDPTIIPPEAYKKRFRYAMDAYFVALVPDKEESISSIV
jgi:1-phosphatidylinositol-3-phosphate 5-kinase